MKCYSHQEVDAVCLCRICMKGLCMGCATQEDNMGTCGSDIYKAELERLTELNQRAMKRYENGGPLKKVLYHSSNFTLSSGAVFVFAGIYNLVVADEMVELGIFLTVIGLVFVGAGIAARRLGKNAMKDKR